MPADTLQGLLDFPNSPFYSTGAEVGKLGDARHPQPSSDLKPKAINTFPPKDAEWELDPG